MADSDALRNLHLVLYLGEGESLETWRRAGIFEREIRYYRDLHAHVKAITFVTRGGREDARLARELNGIRVVCNRWGLPAPLYRAYVQYLRPRFWRRPILIESNSLCGAEVALGAAHKAGALFFSRARHLPAACAEHILGRDTRAALRARGQEGRVFRAARCSAVTTDPLRRFVIERYGVPESRVSVLPNSVDTERFAPDDEWARHPRRLCYVGRLDEKQTYLKMLIEALEGLRVELCLIGTGPDESLLRSESARRGVRLRMLGRLENESIPQQLKLSAAFVMPSRWEAHPTALLEAMSCGMPVIGTDVPGIRELIDHGKTGLLCPPTAEALRAAISQLLGDADLRDRIGRGARAAVLEHAARPLVLRRELAMLRALASAAAESEVEMHDAPPLARILRTLRRRVEEFGLAVALRAIPGDRIEALLTRVAIEHAGRLPADASLRFLFRLERALREKQSREALKYGDGVHPMLHHTNFDDFFVDRINADDRVLVVGCRSGAQPHALATRSGASVVGVDRSALEIAAAKERHAHPHVQYRVGDALEVVSDFEFDVIVLCNVLEHMSHRSEYLSKLVSLPGAPRLLVRVPLFERDWRVPLQRELGLEWRLDRTHETEYTLESFNEEVDRASLSVAHLEVRWGMLSAEIR